MSDDFQGGKATELVRKLLIVGVGTIFLTEESLRSLVADFKLPKDLISGIFESAAKTKNEFLARLSTDIMDRAMEKVDIQKLVEEILAKNEMEFNIKLSFKPKK